MKLQRKGEAIEADDATNAVGDGGMVLPKSGSLC